MTQMESENTELNQLMLQAGNHSIRINSLIISNSYPCQPIISSKGNGHPRKGFDHARLSVKAREIFLQCNNYHAVMQLCTYATIMQFDAGCTRSGESSIESQHIPSIVRSPAAYTLWWSGLYNFLGNARSHPLSDAFFDANHDALIEIYIF